MPRASASRCHCPPDSSCPPVNERPSLVPRPSGSASRHRRVGRHLPGQLPLGQGQVVEHLRVLQVRDAGRPGHRRHQPRLGAVDQPPLHHRAERGLHRPQHQRRRVGHAGEHEREDQAVPGGRAQPVPCRRRDLAHQVARGDQDQVGQDGGRDRVRGHREGQRAAGFPHEPDRCPVPWSGESSRKPFAQSPPQPGKRLCHCTRLPGTKLIKISFAPHPSDPASAPKVPYEPERFGRVPVHAGDRG